MKDESALGIIAHVLGFFTGVVGPFIMYLAIETGSAKEHAKKSFNWQLSFMIYMIISSILSLIIIGILGIIVFGILDAVFCIIAAIKASRNEIWDYPLAIPFIK